MVRAAIVAGEAASVVVDAVARLEGLVGRNGKQFSVVITQPLSAIACGAGHEMIAPGGAKRNPGYQNAIGEPA